MTADANLGCLQISVLCSKIDLSGKKVKKLDFSRSLFWCLNIQYLTFMTSNHHFRYKRLLWSRNG